MARKPDTACESEPAGVKPRSVLVSRFSALGDVALAIPALYNACAASPGVRFVMLTKPHQKGLFINAPANLTVETPDLGAYKGIGGLRRLWRELHGRYAFDAYVDLHDVLRTRVLRCYARLASCRVTTFAKGRRAKQALTRRRRKALVALTPTTERYRNAFLKAGLPLADSFRSLFPAPPDPAVFGSLTPSKREGEYWLAVAPFARHKGKIYPPEQMEKVVEHFATRPDTRVFVFGFGPQETEVIEGWRRRMPAVVNMAAAAIGIPAELALLAYCDTMVSMDSANMHMASLVGLRTVSVWGATHPYCGFMGWHQNPDDAVQLDMACRPCSVFGNKPCRRGDYHCLAGISPKFIIDKIQ